MKDFILTLDFTLIHFLNQFAERSDKFDVLVTLLTDNDLVKTGLMLLIINWAWFKVGDSQFLNRTKLVATLIGVIAAIAIARLIALNAAFRIRPEYDDNLDFVLPYGATPATLDGWSSFPSDHAAMYFALSIGIYFISKRLGLLAIAFSTIFICFSRIYMGHHFLSDVIAGAIIGSVSSGLTVKYLSQSKLSKWIVGVADRYPEYFYPLFVLFMALMYDMFWGARDLASTIIWLLS